MLVSVGDYTTFLRMMKEYKSNPDAYSVSCQQVALDEVSVANVTERSFVGRGSQRRASLSRKSRGGRGSNRGAAYVDMEQEEESNDDEYKSAGKLGGARKRIGAYDHDGYAR